MRRLRLREMGGHAARFLGAGALLGVAGYMGSAPLAIGAAALAFFEVFAATHDVAHGALGLPRRTNEVALGVLGALMMTSGHAMRRMHLEHHKNALGPNDVEGAPAKGSFVAALALGPLHAVRLRVAAFKSAGSRGRKLQAIEFGASALFFAAALASGSLSLLAYGLVCLALHASASFWAAHVPHNAPRWLVRLAEVFAFSGSPTVLALAFHEEHHARPELPCQALGSSC